MPRAKKEDGDIKECLTFQKQCSVRQLQSTCGSSASYFGHQHDSEPHNCTVLPSQTQNLFLKQGIPLTSPGYFKKALMLRSYSKQLKKILGSCKIWFLVSRAQVHLCVYMQAHRYVHVYIYVRTHGQTNLLR